MNIFENHWFKWNKQFGSKSPNKRTYKKPAQKPITSNYQYFMQLYRKRNLNVLITSRLSNGLLYIWKCKMLQVYIWSVLALLHNSFLLLVLVSPFIGIFQLQNLHILVQFSHICPVHCLRIKTEGKQMFQCSMQKTFLN